MFVARKNSLFCHSIYELNIIWLKLLEINRIEWFSRRLTKIHHDIPLEKKETFTRCFDRHTQWNMCISDDIADTHVMVWALCMVCMVWNHQIQFVIIKESKTLSFSDVDGIFMGKLSIDGQSIDRWSKIKKKFLFYTFITNSFLLIKTTPLF